MRRIGIAAFIVVVGLMGCTSSSKTGKTGTKGVAASGTKDPTKQVKITSCGKDALGDVDVKGTAKNDTSKRSDFDIAVAITDKSGKTQLGTTDAFAQNVEAGQTAQWDAPTTVTWKPGLVCKVSTVNRTASL
jgi:uncharacterized lipoprotein NlpE involved in copper resistance